MATRIVFYDEDKNEMNCYLNDKGKVYIGIGQHDEDMDYNGYITLNKEDVKSLIKVLTGCEQEMED